MSSPPPPVYLLKAGETYGPHPVEGLGELIESGWLSPEDHYWREGLDGWQPLAEIIRPAPPDVEEIPPPAAPQETTPQPAPVCPPRERILIYRPSESFFFAYGMGGTIAFHLFVFFILSWNFGYAREIHDYPPPTVDPPMEVSLVTEPAPPPPPPEVVETPPTPPEPLPPPPPLPDVPLPVPPPPAPPEMALPSPPIIPPTPAPPEQIAEQPPLPIPAHPTPPAKKIAKPSHPAVIASTPSDEPVQGDPTDYLDAAPPLYPYEARVRHEQGTVQLLVTLDGGGRPLTVTVEQSSGSRLLDETARAQVLHKWLFKPGTSSRVRVPVQFDLTP